MKARDIIKSLQELTAIYGNWPVIIRANADEDDDVDIGSVYADEEEEKFIISDMFFSV